MHFHQKLTREVRKIGTTRFCRYFPVLFLCAFALLLAAAAAKKNRSQPRERGRCAGGVSLFYAREKRRLNRRANRRYEQTPDSPDRCRQLQWVRRRESNALDAAVRVTLTSGMAIAVHWAHVRIKGQKCAVVLGRLYTEREWLLVHHWF